MTRDEPALCGALMRAAGAVTREEARAALHDAMHAGLSMQQAAEALDTWDRTNAPQVIGEAAS